MIPPNDREEDATSGTTPGSADVADPTLVISDTSNGGVDAVPNPQLLIDAQRC